MTASRSPFAFVVSDLARAGTERREHLETPAAWRLDASRVVPDPPLHADLILRGVPGGIVVTGAVTCTVRHECQRCLAEWDEELHLRITQLVARTDSEEFEDTDYEYDGDELDLEPLLRDEILTDLPLAPVCRDDCPGLETADQTDLNTDASEDATASPFAVLKDLFDTPD
jgi:uncharacterized protein